MKIKSVQIANLWGEYDISMDLNPDVNILVGGNGAGKSTLLKLINAVIPPHRVPEYLSEKVDKVKLLFDDNSVINCVNFRDSFKKLKDKAAADPSYKTMYDDISEDISERKKSRLNFKISASFRNFYRNGQEISGDFFFDNVNTSFLSTFDTPLPKDEDLSSTFSDMMDERPMSHLDKKLFDIMESYSYYIGKLANIIEKKVLQDEDIDKHFLEEVYRQKNLFGEIINSMFQDSGKRMDLSNPKPEFYTEKGKKLSIYDLSSGEKQALYIFLKVLVQNKKDYILLMDEPEISLHVDWQQKLIDNILRLNPNCQIIVSTHSPSMLFEGWDDKVINIEKIRTSK